MKHVKHTKLIALVLTLAMMITGISFGDVTTAQAALTYELINADTNADIENTTVTIKSGGMMNFQYTTGYGSYRSTSQMIKYSWESSDESVATLTIAYLKMDEDTPQIGWITVRGEKAGTATITGTHKTNGKTVSFTVSVTEPKATAKQKKCKHVWKTTRKATCVRNGMKACKKCKLEKVIKQKAHKFVTKKETHEKYQTYPIYVCQCCDCKDPVTGERLYENENDPAHTIDCPKICGEEFDAMDYDTNNNGFDENDVDAAYKAYLKHQNDNKHGTSTLSQYVGYCNPTSYTVTVTRCKSCGQTPEQIKNSGQ